MTSLLILVVMIILLMGAAAYGLIAVATQLQGNIDRLFIQDRLEEAAQAVAANIVSVASSSSQVYYVPAPDNLSSPSVPAWITPHAQTPRGIKFLYCPFSNASGVGSRTITTPTSSYTVNTGNTYSGTNTGSYNYVTQSSTRPANFTSALAILVAPGPRQSSVSVDCLNVTSAGLIAGASVRVITEQEVQSRAQVVAGSGNEFYAASAASGDGKATSSSNFATFATVMDYVNKYRPQRVTVNLKASDTITVTATDLDQASVSSREFSSIRNHSIKLQGLNATNTTSLQYGSSGILSPVTLGSLGFRNVSFPRVNGKLYRPQAEAFGNVVVDVNAPSYSTSLTNMPFVKAVGGSKAIFTGSGNGVMAGSTNTSPTGYEMNYAARGGEIYLSNSGANNFYGPRIGFSNNYLFYADFGGSITNALGTTFYLDGGSDTTRSRFYATAGANIYNYGTLSHSKYGVANSNETSTFYNDIGSRIYALSGAQNLTFYNLDNYNRGGLYAVAIGGSITNAASSSYYWDGDVGAIYAIGRGTFLNGTVTAAAIRTAQSSTSRITALIGGDQTTSTLGNEKMVGTGSGSSQCLGSSTLYSPGFGGGNIAGAYLAPTGIIGMEPSVMVNRTSARCQ